MLDLVCLNTPHYQHNFFRFQVKEKILVSNDGLFLMYVFEFTCIFRLEKRSNIATLSIFFFNSSVVASM